MEIETRHIGSYGGNPATIIELTVKSVNSSITEDISNLFGFVDEQLIITLRNIADELEEHNENKKSIENETKI